MRKPSNILRALRRHGFGILQIVADRMVCAFASRGIKLNRQITIARAAGRIYRFKTAASAWDKVRLNGLRSKDLELMSAALLKTLRYQDTINLVEFATKVGRTSIHLELARTEALWRLKDSAGVEASRERAIALIDNPSRAEISLIKNDNQVINIASRLELLWMTAPNIDEIRRLAENVRVEKSPNPKAFVYWDSGITNAPKLVKTCVSQMRKVYGSELQELSEDVLDDYLDPAPQFKRVAKLWPANYSDAIRVGLLARHGGVWLDATLYVSENSIGKYLNSNLFVFEYNGPRIASWFMSAKAGSYQARLLYATMLDYWSRNRKLKNYFLFHDFFEVLYHLDPQFREEFDSATHLDARPSLAAHNLLWKPFDQDALDAALATRPIQKLTYKPGKKPHGRGTLFAALNQQP